MPKETGNYYVFDTLTANQFIAKVFKDGDDLKVWSGQDHTIHNAAEFDSPHHHWLEIQPMTKQEIDRYLMQPV